MKFNAYIFDIDGTIASNAQRQHWVRTKPKNWAAYNADMPNDKPIESVIEVLIALKQNAKILLCSGREEVSRDITEKWLKENGVPYDELHMRKEKDYRDDCIIKKEILDELKPRFEILAVFDDRPKVCRMWVDNGLFVFRCQQIEEEF